MTPIPAHWCGWDGKTSGGCAVSLKAVWKARHSGGGCCAACPMSVLNMRHQRWELQGEDPAEVPLRFMRFLVRRSSVGARGGASTGMPAGVGPRSERSAMSTGAGHGTSNLLHTCSSSHVQKTARHSCGRPCKHQLVLPAWLLGVHGVSS
eukprot:354957-Chlamydomonas_euryale.AAC.6